MIQGKRRSPITKNVQSPYFNQQFVGINGQNYDTTIPQSSAFQDLSSTFSNLFSDYGYQSVSGVTRTQEVQSQESSDPYSALPGYQIAESLSEDITKILKENNESSNIEELDTEAISNANDVTRGLYSSLGKAGDLAVKAGQALGQSIGGKAGNILSDTATGTQTTINAVKNLKSLSSLEQGTENLQTARTANVAAIAGAAADIADNFLAEKTEYNSPNGSTTKTLDSVYDGISNAAMAFGPIGMIIGGAMKGASLLGKGLNNLGGGTDGMTTTDAILGSSFFNWNVGLINGFGGQTTDTITKDNDAFAQLGSSYSGSEQKIDDAVLKSGKKYGMLSSGAFKKAQSEVLEGKRQQNIITGISDTARDRLNIMNSMSDINSNRRLLAMSGGYNQASVRVGRKGMILVKRVVNRYNVQSRRRLLENKNSIRSDISEIELIQDPTFISEIQLDDVQELKKGGILEIQLEEVQKLEEGGEIEKESPIKYSIRRFPILASLEPINLQYDPNFKPKEIGDFGDIEYMQAQHDFLPYYNNYPKQDNYKGKSTIIYNDNVINEAIALDWLSHGLREYDSKWGKFLEQLEMDQEWKDKITDELYGIFLNNKGISIEKYHRLPKKQRTSLEKEFNEQEISKELKDSVIDGLIRGILVSPEYRDQLNYGPIEEYENLTQSFIWQLAQEYLNKSVTKFKEGGSFNVIPEGALHARLHHMENDENITKKGIPVVSENENGELEQHAEIEREEIILRLSLTKRLEELAKENTDDAALEAGKLLVEEILNNTIDNTELLTNIN